MYESAYPLVAGPEQQEVLEPGVVRGLEEANLSRLSHSVCHSCSEYTSPDWKTKHDYCNTSVSQNEATKSYIGQNTYRVFGMLRVSVYP